MAGVWKQHQLWDGTYNLSDLLDIIEALQVKAENQRMTVDNIKETPC